ncbi:MAG: bifunctional proline dehydrogenase/L-glutamate gamma-semialdehyde dehydrogenase PutA [Rhizobiaceae bacterium]
MQADLRDNIRSRTYLAEEQCVKDLTQMLALAASERLAISADAARLVERIRERGEAGLMEKFLSEYGLNTDEGVALMCLAEAYLRTPDADTLDELISDKIGGGDWARHLGKAQSALVNASTWALMLTGRVFRTIPAQAEDLATVMHSMVKRLGEPVARTAVGEAMKLLGRQFVLGRTITEAIANGSELVDAGYLHSYDMLGEAARTASDADRYFTAYANAIIAIGKVARHDWPHDNSGISVKLSALHPRYETVNRERVLAELSPRVTELCRMAKSANIPLAIDAEEADRLDLSLDVIESVLSSKSLAGWDGFGIVVQAYSRRAPAVLDWLHDLAARLDRNISVRLVKGAYWDSEIKIAQVGGLGGYPVFTRKETTDLSYLACARKLLGMTDRIYPQFATHNAHSVSAIAAMGGDRRFEFQRLHGMGEALHEISRAADSKRRRIYAPVGIHKDLLAYLVRRLLENGANSSFVHRILDKSVSPSQIAADPVAAVEMARPLQHPAIPLPADIHGAHRINSRGWNLNDPAELAALEQQMAGFHEVQWGKGGARALTNPASRSEIVGHVHDADAGEAKAAIEKALGALPAWSAFSADARAAILEKIAGMYEENAAELMALAVREAGKTRFDAVAEIREAVDFLRYYAYQARQLPADARALGPVLCISPWNFPLAIFTGQIAGALAGGNTVIAKPAEQTPLISQFAARLFAGAGLPEGVLNIVQGDGARIGPVLTGDPRIAGVVFTGSNETARAIDISMARDGNPDAPLIAETGGLNAMIVDSTALPEQAVRDILASAFQSAGQRCSALRVLYVQKEIAPQLIEMLEGAAQELSIGDPWLPSTDVGPVIDDEARKIIKDHCEKLAAQRRQLFKLDLPAHCTAGTFVAPAAFRIGSISELEREIFGPVLHVVEFDASEIDKVVAEINAAGYGLTLGVHSRIDTRVDRICEAAHIGNIYVNRNQIGAVVGVQPFGGEGLSGTGPKAGGPHYVERLVSTASTGAQLPASTVLKGPTGEQNSYRLSPRGQVACLGPSLQDRKAQAAMAARAGNKILETQAMSDRFLAELEADRLDVVMCMSPVPGELRTALAMKQGRRIPILATLGSSGMLYTETSISEDTTASGGNASLLSAVS